MENSITPEYKIEYIQKKFKDINERIGKDKYILKDYHKEVILEDKKWFCNWRGTGATKTLTTLLVSEGNTLVITPKTLTEQQTWIKEKEKFDLHWLNVKQVSKELFKYSEKCKTLPTTGIDTLIIDESHHFFGIYTSKKKVKNEHGKQEWVMDYSNSFINLYKYIKKVNPKRLYLLTATPTGNKDPIKLYSATKLLGEEWDFDKFVEKYYDKVPNYRKVKSNGVWVAKSRGNKIIRKVSKELDDRIASVYRRYGYTGSIFDFNTVPEQVHLPVYFNLNSEQKKQITKTKEAIQDPNLWKGVQRSIESGRTFEFSISQNGKTEELSFKNGSIHIDKDDYILERAEEFDKIVIFARYRKQCDYITSYLQKAGYTVYQLDGRTKDRTHFQEDGIVNKLDKCICVIQASVVEGYDLNTFRTIIYASMSESLLHYTQSKGRPLRTSNLQSNLFLYLVTKDGEDERCYNAIMDFKDFDEKMNKYTYD